jgi:hypothetical protein
MSGLLPARKIKRRQCPLGTSTRQQQNFNKKQKPGKKLKQKVRYKNPGTKLAKKNTKKTHAMASYISGSSLE